MKSAPKDAKPCWGCGDQRPLNQFSLLCRPCEVDVKLKVGNKDYNYIRETK